MMVDGPASLGSRPVLLGRSAHSGPDADSLLQRMAAMKKLRLELDNLQVESFSTDRMEEAKGTVHGFISLMCSAHDRCNTVDISCNDLSCGGYTCALSCACE